MKKKSFSKKLTLTIVVIALIIAILLGTVFVIKNRNGKLNVIEEDQILKLGITDESETESWDTDMLSIYEDTSLTDSSGNQITMYVPVPGGYVVSNVASESTVAGGLVIYEGTDEVTDDNVADAKKTRNQYVWIPVNPDDVYWTDENGQRYGKHYEWSSAGYTTSNMKLEPVVSTDYMNEDYILDGYNADEESKLELLEELLQDFDEMVESIEKYGGFYIGRYELGDSVSTSRDANSTATYKPVVMQGKYSYNVIDWYEAISLCKELSGTNNNVKTSLIWEVLYDITLKWFVEMSGMTYSEMLNSANWGNLANTTFEYTDINGVTQEKKYGSTGGGTIIPTRKH